MIRLTYLPKAVCLSFIHLIQLSKHLLAESEIPFVLRNFDGTQQPTVYLNISVSAGSGTTNTSELATQEVDGFPDNTLSVTFAASDSASSPQDTMHVGSGIPTSLTEEGQTEMLSTEKALDEADQAVNSIHPALGMVVKTAKIITTAPDVIDNVVSVYKTWEEAVATMKAVMVIVDKIAEVIINLSAYT